MLVRQAVEDARKQLLALGTCLSQEYDSTQAARGARTVLELKRKQISTILSQQESIVSCTPDPPRYSANHISSYIPT